MTRRTALWSLLAPLAVKPAQALIKRPNYQPVQVLAPEVKRRRYYSACYQMGLDALVFHGTQKIEVSIPFDRARSFVVASLDAPVTVRAVTVRAVTRGPFFFYKEVELAKGEVRVWGHDFAEKSPFRGDVTRLYVTNHSATPASFKMRVLHD